MKPDPVQSVKSRRGQVREEVIEDILAIAREMMRQDGVAALSFNAIARRLGIQPPSLYTYFESKNAIYDELFRRGFVEFGQWMGQRPGQDGSVRDNLQSVMETYMRFAQQNPDLYQLMFQRPVPDFVPSDASMATSLAELEKAQQHFAAILSGGDLQIDMPVEEARDLFIALQHGLTELHLANNPDLPVGEGRFGKLIPNAVQLLMDSWTKHPTKP
jgi:AcrR family transcriptional regulator